MRYLIVMVVLALAGCDGGIPFEDDVCATEGVEECCPECSPIVIEEHCDDAQLRAENAALRALVESYKRALEECRTGDGECPEKTALYYECNTALNECNYALEACEYDDEDSDSD